MANKAIKVRLVHCPNCWNLLTELPDASLYRCGNCAVNLVAKCHDDGKKNISESSEKISCPKDEPRNQGGPCTYSETEAEIKCEEQNSRLLEDSIMENKHELESDKKVSTSNMKPSSNTEQSEFGEEETLTGMKTLHQRSGIGVIKKNCEENYDQENNDCNPESSTKDESLILSKKKINHPVSGAIFSRTHQYEEEEKEEESRNSNASSSHKIELLVSEDTYYRRTKNKELKFKEKASVQRDESSRYQERLLHDIKNMSLPVGQHDHDHTETNSKMEETVKPVPHPGIYETYVTNIQHTTEHHNPPRKESKISNDYHNHNARSSKQSNILSNQLNKYQSSGHVVYTSEDTNKSSKQMNMDEYDCSEFYQRHESNIYQKLNTSNCRQPYLLDSQQSYLPKYEEYLKEGQRIFPRKENNCDFTSRTNGWKFVPEFPIGSTQTMWDFWEHHQSRNSQSSNYQPELNEVYVPINCMPHMSRYQRTPIFGSPPRCSHLSNSCSYWYSDNQWLHVQIPHSYHCNGKPCNPHLSQTYSQSCSSYFSDDKLHYNCKNPPGQPIKKREFQILSYWEANPMSKHHWRSLDGGSPFFFCDNCFKLLQLPSHPMFPKKKFDKIRCGSCSKILIFDHPVKQSHSDLRFTDTDGSSHTLRRNEASEEHVNNFLQRERISSSNNDPTVSRNQMSEREKALPEEFESNSMGRPGVISIYTDSFPHGEQFDKSSLRRREDSFQQGQSMNTYDITDNHMDRRYLADYEIKEKESLTSRSSRESIIRLIKNGTQEIHQGRVSEQNVYVNDKLIPYHKVKRAEKKAGPIQPGKYWYDIRAGFWGSMGQPCRGVIPAFIKEFDHPMSRNCAGGSSGFIVNGRELHDEDLNLLLERGLPTTGNKEYIIEKDGQIFDKESRRDLGYIINFAPTVEKIGRGFGMF